MFSLGIDLGGTSVKWALVDEDCNIVASDSVTTSQAGTAAVIDQLASIASQFISLHREPVALGLAIPASVDPAQPEIRVLPNIPGDWEGINLRDELENRLGRRCSVLNDARAFAYGEWHSLAPRGYSDVLFVTLGTGVGGAAVLGNQLHLGAGGLAGEIGHLNVIPEGRACACGSKGCLEMYAGGGGILTSARSLGWVPDEGGDPSDPGAVFLSARRGDSYAREAVSLAASSLGFALGKLSVFLTPQAIVFGGGLSGSFSQLKAPLLAAMEDELAFIPQPEFFVATDTTYAGARGAGLWAQQEKEKERA